MKKSAWVVVLGGGTGQLSLIKAAQELGFKALVIGAPGDYPGYQIADRVEEFDFKDKKRLLELASKYRVLGVVTQIDIAVPIVAWLADRLSVPSIGKNMAELFTDKHKMRVLGDKHGVTSPNWKLLISYDQIDSILEEFYLPIVVKPVDATASKGVSIVNDKEGVYAAVKEAFENSPSSRVLVEDYIAGEEYVFDALINKSKAIVVGGGLRINFKLDKKCIPSKTIFYDVSEDELLQRLISDYEKYLEASGLEWGISQAEFMVDRTTNKYYFLEAAARGGGAAIASDLVPLQSGININQCLVKMSIGDELVLAKHPEPKKIAAYICCYLHPGMLSESFSISKVKEVEGVIKIYGRDIPAGSVISKIQHKGNRLGPIIVTADNMDELESVIMAVQYALRDEPKYSDKTRRPPVWE